MSTDRIKKNQQIFNLSKLLEETKAYISGSQTFLVCPPNKMYDIKPKNLIIRLIFLGLNYTEFMIN